ncbi:Leucine-rich repeat domain superfamily [Sesbania bispinosa]|nr:Leucine-rich repeat domain superfamily [Sesbania bispinosa]
MVNEGKSKEIDRISKLPDEVLCHILSFLPSKEAIATSTLSTRWRSLWTMVPVLDFEHFGRSVSNNKMEVDPYAANVPEFHNLVHLELYLRDGESIFLKQIPMSCPHLEALLITVRKDCEFHITDGLWDI